MDNMKYRAALANTVLSIIFFIPYGSLSFAHKIIVPAAIIIFDEVRNIYGEIKKKKKDEIDKPA